MNLTINEGLLQVSEEKSVPAVLFSGNFDYQIAGTEPEVRLQDLQQILQNWKINLETYKELINNKFLSNKIDDKNLITFGVPISPSV